MDGLSGNGWSRDKWTDSRLVVEAEIESEVINEGEKKEFPCSPNFLTIYYRFSRLDSFAPSALMVVLRLFFPLGCLPAWNWSSFLVNSQWLALRNGNFTIFSPCCSKESPLNDGFTTSFPLPLLFANAEPGHSPMNSWWPIFLPYSMTEIIAQHNSGDNSLFSTFNIACSCRIGNRFPPLALQQRLGDWASPTCAS